MIKKLLNILLIVSLFSCEKTPEITNSQDDFHLKVFGGTYIDSTKSPYTDDPDSIDCCYAVLSAGEGFCLTGSIEYSRNRNLFLIVTDKYGNEVDWSPKLFGTDGIEVGYDISVDKDQNFVMVGYSLSSGSTETDAFVVKASSSGEELWSKRFGGPGNEVAYALNTSVPNIIYVAGYTESDNFDIKRRQGWLLALSENGDSIWSHDYGTSFVPDELHGITEMNDSLLLVGTTQSLFSTFKQDVLVFILKKTTRGIENSATLYRDGDDVGLSAVYLPSGDIFVLGYTKVSADVNNVLIWKLNKDLQKIKEIQLSATISETPATLRYENGYITVFGTAVNDQGNEDYLVYVLDSNLNKLSRNLFGSKGDQRGKAGIVRGRSAIIGGSTISGNSSKASIFKTPEILP